MKNTLDPVTDNQYNEFLGIASEIFGGTLSGIFDRQVSVALNEAFTCDAGTLPEGFESGALVVATEEKTGFEAGMMFSIADITSMTDMMMMGEGTPKAELDPDAKDGAKELAAQMLGALTVPVEEQLGKKISLKVDDVIGNDNVAIFQAESYLAFDFTADVEGQPIPFRVFVDGELSFLLESSEGGTPAGGGGGGESGERSGGYSGGGPANLDMLLDIEVPVSVRMGTTKVFLKDIVSMGPGNVVELDESADDPVELTVNDKVVARGEVVIVDGYFGFRIKEIISKAERLKKLKD